MRACRGAGDGHDAGDDRDADAGQFAAVAEVEEVVVVEEQLRADVVGAGVDLGLEVVHLEHAVGRGGVAFGEAGDADAEAARVGMAAALVELADEAHEVGRVLEGVLVAVVAGEVARRVAAEGEDVADAGLGVAFEDGLDVRLAVADAGEVGIGIERGRGL
jgi:hypothetical protein